MPVPAEILIYTEDEWRSLEARNPTFVHRLAREVVCGVVWWLAVAERRAKGDGVMDVSGEGARHGRVPAEMAVRS